MKKIEILTRTDIKNEIYNLLNKSGETFTGMQLSNRFVNEYRTEIKKLREEVEVLTKLFVRLRDEVEILKK